MRASDYADTIAVAHGGLRGTAAGLNEPEDPDWVPTQQLEPVVVGQLGVMKWSAYAVL